MRSIEFSHFLHRLMGLWRDSRHVGMNFLILGWIKRGVTWLVLIGFKASLKDVSLDCQLRGDKWINFGGNVNAKSSIRKGDKLEHGGEITSGSLWTTFMGRPLACKGDEATCELHGRTVIDERGHRQVSRSQPQAVRTGRPSLRMWLSADLVVAERPLRVMPVDLSRAGLPSAYPRRSRFWPWWFCILLACVVFGAAIVLPIGLEGCINHTQRI